MLIQHCDWINLALLYCMYMPLPFFFYPTTENYNFAICFASKSGRVYLSQNSWLYAKVTWWDSNLARWCVCPLRYCRSSPMTCFRRHVKPAGPAGGLPLLPRSIYCKYYLVETLGEIASLQYLCSLAASKYYLVETLDEMASLNIIWSRISVK